MSTDTFIKRVKMNIDGSKFIGRDKSDEFSWSQSRERDNAPRNSSAFLSEGWGEV